MESIAILKRTSFGDIIHALPVVSTLRAAHPNVKICWITEQGYGPFIAAHEGIDEVVEIGFRSMLKRKRLSLYRQRLRRLALENFDVLLDLQGTLKSWVLLFLSRASQKVGFNPADAREPIITKTYSIAAAPMPYGLHIIRQNLRLLEPLGIENEEIVWPEMHFDPADESYIKNQLSGYQDRRIIAINPITNWKTKCWPAGHIVRLCRMIREQTDMRPMILWGPREERKVEAIVRATNGAASLAPKTTLVQLAALLRRCHAYIGGDTGPTHLAGELGVPVIALFGPTDPRRNGPVNPDDEVLWLHMECKGCRRNVCRLNDDGPECLFRISPIDVFETLQRRLEKASQAE